tara:strand:- start:111365 stop:111838 length:474 start_codon:yes stop_codon:yes gene_type:complete
MKNKKPKNIDVSKIDLERMKTFTSENPNTLAYGDNRGSAKVEKVDTDKIKSKAFKIMNKRLSEQVEDIVEQINNLQTQLAKIQFKRENSEELYYASIGFDPVIEQTYYLYQKEEGKTISLVSPTEWGEESMKEKKMFYLATVKLLSDYTWEILDGEI